MIIRFVSDTLVPPFNIVEKESFNNMICSFDPRAKPVSGNKVRDTLVMLEFNVQYERIGHEELSCFTYT